MSHPNDQGAKQGSVVEDLISIFYKPSDVFEHQRDKSFVVPALVQTILLTLLAFALHNLIEPFLDADFARGMAKAAASGKPMPEQAKGMMETVQKFSLYAGALLGPWFIALIGGVVVWLFSKIVSAKMQVGQAMMIASWAAMPMILGTITMAIFGVMADPQTVRGSADGQLGALRFVDLDTASPLVTELLRRLDLFGIWEVVLTGIGISVVGRVSRGSGFVAAGVRWALVALVFGMCASLSPK
ncbi:MAG: YIP1 family protein [Gemmatimonas sp.]